METFRLEGVTKKRPLPSFIKKLWFILADTTTQDYIFWADKGQVVCVPNAVSFSKVILPKHFKHNNWQSFVRQLNLYGFRKVYQLNLSYDDTAEKRTVWQFKHDCFRKDQPEKLCDIKRRTAKHNQEQYNTIAAASLPPSMRDPIVIPHRRSSNNTSPYHNTQVDQQISQLRARLEYVEQKRIELYDQTVQLGKIQENQQKAIHVLVDCIAQLTSQNPNTENQMLHIQNTMKKLLNPNLQPRPPPSNYHCQQKQQQQQQHRQINYDYYENDYDYDSDHQSDQSLSSSSGHSSSNHGNISPISNTHFPTRTNIQQQPQPQHPLPSISSLIGNNSNRILPPLSKRPNNNSRH